MLSVWPSVASICAVKRRPRVAIATAPPCSRDVGDRHPGQRLHGTGAAEQVVTPLAGGPNEISAATAGGGGTCRAGMSAISMATTRVATLPDVSVATMVTAWVPIARAGVFSVKPSPLPRGADSPSSR